VIVYGIHPVLEALRAGRVRALRIGARDDRRVSALVEQARALGVTVRQVPMDVLDRESRHGVHQGVVADVEGAPEGSIESFTASLSPPPLIVVLDEVEDPQNVGAILRTMDAAGATGLVRQTRRAAALDGAAAKASAGAVHHVAVADVVNIARAVEALKAAGVWTVGLDAEAELAYHEWDLTLPTALVLGAEGHGLRRLVRERCDGLARIPMQGHVGSLNVSAAAAIVLFEAVRQRSRGRERGRGPGVRPGDGHTAGRLDSGGG
jgi:23S rRNA (guanosine2251-2'-O)-methyltransferase